MPASATDYTPGFYETIRDGCRSSAAVVAPLLHALLRPDSVIDVGCGEGWWAEAYADLGCAVVGIDGDYVPSSPLGDRFVVADLREPLPELHADLVLCLEVAEHLPPERAEGFVADLCRMAPLVAFSAAIPGQSGAGHVNCQWPSYWAELFGRQGRRLTGALRWRIWNDERVEPWYRQNLLVAWPQDSAIPDELVWDMPPADVVHPIIHNWGKP